MSLLRMANLLSRLHNGHGLKFEELLQLEADLQEQLQWVTELRVKMGKGNR
ncbi:hypothetical protein H1D32_13250 [Anaerobacillus sp. CMMVII]|uniref:hypothetical protein n=1 Tax=Anaerobacillus sp. CMMVII TaxID=2755588 RepID=UPI0021B8224F|nr:hypothetical protein [Anaerobacillus sp. CMMVII]MCT8138622.1 hypothetical protein [Anaerobacillus sp. CMMVII]